MSSQSPPPPPPSGQALSLVSALSNPENHELHVQAIRARDEALSASLDSYNHLLVQLAYVFYGCDQPQDMIARMDPAELQLWKQTDAISVAKLEQSSSLWVPFGQMAGLLLKNALVMPPSQQHQTHNALYLQPQAANQVKQVLLHAVVHCQHAPLRAVASTAIAAVTVSPDSMQPEMCLAAWPELIPTLLSHLTPSSSSSSPSSPAITPGIHGCLEVIRKILEDGPNELSPDQLDYIVPVLLRYMIVTETAVQALQSMASILSAELFPSALVANFDLYLQHLSTLASLTTTSSPQIRQWVCYNLVTLLEQRTEYLYAHFASICPFILQCTADIQHPTVALEACEFWLTVASLGDQVNVEHIHEVVGNLLPQLIPVLLNNMIYGPEERAEMEIENEMDLQQSQQVNQNMRPVFHKSRAQHATKMKKSSNTHTIDHDNFDNDNLDENDDDDDDDDDDAFDGNQWTLRKCSAASLDALANLFGADLILPSLLPALEQGLSSNDAWIQEASVLALGAIAEGCVEEMSEHMPKIHPYLMNCLASPNALPQLQSITAWTMGRYASWALEQVQTGEQGHLLAQMIQVLLARLQDRNRRLQVAVCAALGAIVETFGDLMVPYLEPTFDALVHAMSWCQGRSLLVVFETFGTIADYCGQTIAEGNLPTIYVPPLFHVWNELAKVDPADKRLLPLMESLASIAMASSVNFQPYAKEAFEKAMATMEAVTLDLSTTAGDGIQNDEDVDPIVCAADLIDGLVEGMGANFETLVSSSQRFVQHFLTVLVQLCQHEIASVRMSAFALVGDLARNAPSLIEPALKELIKETVVSMDPIQPSVCLNAVWAMGEICVRCEGNPSILEPHAPYIMEKLVPLLVGNDIDDGGGVDIQGLVENTAACAGRLSKVHAQFVAPDLPRFFIGWCNGLAKTTDPTERRDGFLGLLNAMYSNHTAILNASENVSESFLALVFAISTWHMPPEFPDEPAKVLYGDYLFLPFPSSEPELHRQLSELVRNVVDLVGKDAWTRIQKDLPVNLRRLMREQYNV